MLADLTWLRAYDSSFVIPAADVKKITLLIFNISTWSCDQLPPARPRSYTLKPATKVLQTYGYDASTIGVLLLVFIYKCGPGFMNTYLLATLRLHGSFYVSGVPSEKVAEVRRAEKGVAFQAALMRFIHPSWFATLACPKPN